MSGKWKRGPEPEPEQVASTEDEEMGLVGAEADDAEAEFIRR